MNETSPLLSARTSAEEEDGLKDVASPSSDDDWDAEAGEETKSSWYLLLLTLAGGGLQIAWSVELSYGSPYLLSLGLSKSLLALVWIAGPLSGTLVQPYVGLKSDNCRLKYGKRRPFIVGGAISTIISLFFLAWAREIVAGFLSIFGVAWNSSATKTTTILFAVVMVYILDFAINVIQAAIRAFVVDCAPTHQQEAANAWIMRTTGIGNILGYLSGYVNLPKLFPFLGNTQMKVLCAIACMALAITVTISCATVSERDPRMEGTPKPSGGLMGFFKNLFLSIRRLPPQVSRVCQVQLAAWIGWFPFLFYTTTYIGEIYTDPYFQENPHMTEDEINKVWEKGTRMGTLALFIFAITTFIASVFLPLIVAPTYKPPAPEPTTPLTPTASMAGSGYFALKKHNSSKKSWKFHLNVLDHLQIKWLTLRRAWLLSHIVFAALTWATFFVHTSTGATVIVALIGIPWAITNWAPFALISQEISKRDAIRRGLLRAPPTQDGALLAAGEDDSADQAGVVLGIHNVAIAAPQVIATLVSSALFKALQKPRGTPGDDSVAWVLRFGGCCALIAAFLTKRVYEENQDALQASARVGQGSSRQGES
ncbi:Major facilitator superfamily domain general substrate transporter [Macrophomina phaseolina MS6]|uniref:Major facilitator superfamily domain general substrate transporter n=2 Tax=Macrophomina phaseolina TaxID=35725 RepID=K2RMB0_MACPH|nr:Major facilitator superfamily domain general substrate transporter [Macrophomina phaseolina MS6]